MKLTVLMRKYAYDPEDICIIHFLIYSSPEKQNVSTVYMKFVYVYFVYVYCIFVLCSLTFILVLE